MRLDLAPKNIEEKRKATFMTNNIVGYLLVKRHE